ncbi:MAG: tetratricopeptide repeat protein [Treponema sp.]|jgi:tetratricopeptide (TPR) repeat protein|nr:tetratricopeptide repeat protein [Treponema sp.]
MSADIQVSGDREVRLQSGISLALTGNLEDAAAAFNALLAENSRDTDVLNNLAIVYLRQEKFQDALGALLDAIDADPTKAEFQYNLGKVYKQLGNFKSAAMACAKAVESDPSLVPAYINLGAMYCLLREFGKAANIFKKGLDLDPASGVLRANYDAALKAKQAAESPDGRSAEELSAADIAEAGDIFMGVSANAAGLPVAGTAPVPPGGTPADAPAPAALYTITGIVGLLRYLLTLAVFFPASARRVFSEQDTERRIKDLANALSNLEEEGPRAIPEPVPAAETMPALTSGPAAEAVPEITAAAPGPAGGRVSIASLTGLLNHLGKLAQDLPQAEQRNILKQKVGNIIEGLNATI